MIFVVLSYWFCARYTKAWDPAAGVSPFFNVEVGPSWLRVFIRANLQSSWGFHVFVLVSGFVDRISRNDPLISQLRLDLLLLILYLACSWPLPQLCEQVAHRIGNPTIDIGNGSGHRWYLACVLLCRALHHILLSPLASLLKRQQSKLGAPVVLVLLLVAFSALAIYQPPVPNLCAGGVAGDSRAARVLPFLTVESPSPQHGRCPFARASQWDLMLVLSVTYAAAWWFVKPLVGYFRRWSWPRSTGAFFVLLAFLSALAVAGILDEQNLRPPRHGRILFDISLAIMVMLFISMLRGPHILEASQLVLMGRYYLGAFLLSCWVMSSSGSVDSSTVVTWRINGREVIPDVFTSFSYVHALSGFGILELVVLIVYAVVFTLVPALALREASIVIEQTHACCCRPDPEVE